MSPSLADRARAVLATLPDADTLEAWWERAALEAVAEGEQFALDRARIRAMASPSRVWEHLPRWPAERVQARVAALLHTGRLAIIEDDVAWLHELDEAWQRIPGQHDDALAVLRARGELGLALGARGSRPAGWDADELVALIDEGFLLPDSAADEAWQALASGDHPRAQRALMRLRAEIDVARTTRGDDEAALRQIRAHPASVLDVEARALEALVARQKGTP